MHPKTQTRSFPIKKREMPVKLVDLIPIASLDSILEAWIWFPTELINPTISLRLSSIILKGFNDPKPEILYVVLDFRRDFLKTVE